MARTKQTFRSYSVNKNPLLNPVQKKKKQKKIKNPFHDENADAEMEEEEETITEGNPDADLQKAIKLT